MDKKFVENLILSDNCYSASELRYNQKVGLNFSKDELKSFLDIKDQLTEDGTDYIKRLPLKTFNSKHCFFVDGEYLKSLRQMYIDIMTFDFDMNQKSLFERSAGDVLISRLFSEVEGTLRIENVPTTHKRISEIYNGKDIVDTNDQIVQNMLNAIMYLTKEKPKFAKENLLKLYTILSKGCLNEEDRLLTGNYYRHDMVYIASFEGAPVDFLEEAMDSLFDFANDPQNIQKYGILLPYICQYYILYLHPYFDYNGRTARMVSFWLCYVNKINFAPLFMSEAINETKQVYYKALSDTRQMRNDLTYFLGYILETSIKFSIVYKNLEEIKSGLMKTGDTLSSLEWTYLKKIVIHNPKDFFNQKMFAEYINSDISKTGALKILNKFTEYNILLKSRNKRNETIYKMNPEYVVYSY